MRLKTVKRKHWKIVKGLLTTEDLMRMFNRNSLTIHLWRKNHRLPHLIFPAKKPMVRFIRHEVLKWAEEGGREIYHIGPSRKRKQAINPQLVSDEDD